MKAKKILAMLLSLTMIFALTVPALADTANKAKIGDNEYPTLADAIAAVPTNGTATTITMIGNEEIETTATGNVVTVESGKNIVLDLNSYTISGTSTQKSNYFIANYGTLEVKDSSANENGKITFQAVADSGYSVENVTVLNEGGTLTLSSGIIENTTNGGLSYAVKNSSNAWANSIISTFNMTGGILRGAKTDNTLRVYQNTGVSWKVNSKNYVNISGGAIENGIFIDTFLHTKDQDLEGYTADDITKGAVIDTEINISGGTVNGLIDMKMRHPFSTELNITGGDFTNAKLRVRKYTSEYGVNAKAGTLAEPSAPVVNISGGNFTFADVNNAFLTANWTSYDNAYSITGGTYNFAPTTYVADGYTAVDNNNGTYTVLPAVTYVAQIGGVKYETLAEAFAAVQEGQTITLLANTETGETYTHSNPLVLDTDNVTLDLGGNTLTITSNMSLVVRSDNGVVTNGTIVPGITDTKVTNWCRYGLTIDDCDGVTISDIVSQTGIAIGGDPDDNYTPGAAPATNVTISGCTVTGRTSRYAVFAQNFSTATITGGTYNAASATAGVLYAAFSATDGNPGVINITGGKFFGTITQKNAGSIIVKGGEYSKTPAAFVADGYEVTDNADATYPFAVEKVKVYVAQTGGVEYETLAAAIEAAEVGGTVTLLTDIDVTSTINITKNLTIDGNNKTINVTGGAGGYGIYIKDESTGSLTVDISDLTLNTTGYQVALLLNSDFGSKVNIENVDINCDGECIYSNGLGTVTATGCDFSHTGTYAPGKDAVYYSALIVGYGGEIIAENCTVTSFGNGAATFPSGGTITLTNTDITINEDTESETNAGYAMWSRNEDYTNYPEYCRDSVITFNSGSVYGDFKITDKYTSGDKNLYDPVIVIKGGTFSEDPSAYVATGYEAVNNGDGTYTVRSATPTATVGMSITLEDNIVVNFFVSELSHSPARYTVNYRFEGGTATEANLGEVVEYESGIYRFAVATATAKQMTDKVYFDVYADDTLIKTVTYSIAQYCDTQTSTSADAELVELCKATSTFGAKAQAYFNYKTGNAPVDYSEEFDASEIPSASEYAAEKSAAVTYPVSASLNLLSKTELNFYIYNTASYYEIYGVEEKLSDSDSWNNITVSQERNNDGKMKVTIPGVSPDRLDNTYRLHIASDEYVTYSPLTYVTRHANDGDALGALCQSLYFYYKTARDYTAN